MLTEEEIAKLRYTPSGLFKGASMDKPEADSVNHPPHYNIGKIEVIEAIEDWKLSYHRGAAVKYIVRAGHKDPAKEAEDLEKAVWYLRREIELVKSRQAGRAALRPNDMPQERAK